MSTLDTDLNTPPYFDDYDEDKSFHKVVFKPGVAVQARELTQLQTIQQKQIERFGNHVFKDGSIVDGVPITYYPNTHYISLADNFNTNTSLFAASIDSTYLVTNSEDSNTAVRAVVKVSKNGIQTAAPETNRFYLDYISTGKNAANNDVSEFSPGDTLYVYDSNQGKFASLDSNNLFDSISTLSTNSSFDADGYSYMVGVGDGTVFQKGFFVKVSPSVINISDFSTNVAGYIVGFQTTETIINENTDTSLLDNALGYTNENAPGAHRLKLTPSLVAKLKTDTSNNTNFFSIIEFDQSEPVEQKDSAAYNTMQEQFSRRTYEESGDYVTTPFQVEARASSNTQTFNYEISPGIAYVRGNRIEKIGTTRVEADRAISTKIAQNQIITGNYGNYVVCDEVLGAFDLETIVEISLYDAPQNAISEYEGVSSAPSGSEVGKANVRAVVHNNGTQGIPGSTYHVYLFNIRMNSGKSFSSDVKSLYVDGTFGKAKADVKLEGSSAVLKESTNLSSDFDTGISAIKRLTNNTGIGDTSYIFNQIKSGTIASTGIVNITIDTAATGASAERLNQTSGSVLTGSSAQEYNIFASANAYTANLTGTINFASGNTTITGTSTSFDTELEANSNIRIQANSTSTHIRRVVSIANSTQLVISAPIAASNTTSNYNKYFVTGTPLPIANVTINSNTSFSANLGAVLDSGSQTVYCSYPVNRNQASAIPKIINKNVFVKIDCSNNAATSVGPWDMGHSDVHKIRHIYVGASYANTNPDRLAWFDLDNGMRDAMYEHGRLVIKPEYAASITGSSKMLVEFDHFDANTSASVGFFSAESYPIDDVDTANTDAVQSIEIGSRRNTIDFRVVKSNTAVSSTTEGGATINPALNTNVFDVPAGGQYMLMPDTNFTADVEYYLPRIDLVGLDSSGRFVVNSGEPAEVPVAPYVEGDQSVVFECFVPAFPSATKREYDTNLNDAFIRTDAKMIKRYRMRDIRAIEERLGVIEYTTTLNSLEQQAKSLTVPDANGLDRFKNGIFADPFVNHNNGQTDNFEYKISIDKDENIARPFFNTHKVDFEYLSANSSNTTKTGPVVTLDFTSEQYISQSYATKVRNCTESVWDWTGDIDLYPSMDFHRDEVNEPNRNLVSTIDPAGFGTNFGDWRTRVEGFNTTSFNLGEYVKDVTINPYMQSRLVAFIAHNMKPNTIIHAHFDGINVDAHCAPGAASGVSDPQAGVEHRVVDRTAGFGDNLVSGADGSVYGIFRVPAATFRTGDREFRLSDASDLDVGGDASVTNSKAVYTADSVSVTKESTTLSLRQPIVRTVRTPVTPATPRVIDGPGGDGDPIAQSFSVKNIPDNTSSLFLTQVGVFFQTKDPTLGCTVFICEMNAGRPDSSRILGKAFKESAAISTSATGATETVFTLDYPVNLIAGKEYAFFVQPNGNSPEYKIWVGETGGFDVATDEQVFSNPYSGMVFVSANRNTWTAIQKEDLKFNLYRASFETSGTAVFKNDSDEYLTVDGFTRANTDVGIDVGDIVYTVNSSIGTVNNTTIASNTLLDKVTGIVQYLDEASGIVYLDSSIANTTTYFSNTTNPTIAVYRPADLSNTALVNANTLIAYANVDSVDNLSYHSVVPKFGSLQPSLTNMGFAFKGTSNTNIFDASSQQVINDLDYQFTDSERKAISRSNEINDLSGSKSSEFIVTMGSSSSYVSPMIDLSKKSSLFIQNKINNDSTDEHTRYGNALTRYISKKVVLKDGQEAEDIKVFITAYRPFDTDVEVYAKFWNNQDPEDFNDKVWTKLSYDDDSNTVYSSSANTSDFIEYELSVPTSNTVDYGAFSNTDTETATSLTGTITIANNSNIITGAGTAFDTELSAGQRINVVSGSYEAIRTVTNIANSTQITVDNGLIASNSAALHYVFSTVGNDGIVEYENTAGSRFIGYKEVALKIVLLSSNAVKVPKVDDIRALCLQV